MEPRWSLDGKDKAEGEAPLKTCPECETLVPFGTRVCDNCGFEFAERSGYMIAPDKTGEREHITEQKIMDAMAENASWLQAQLGLAHGAGARLAVTA